MVLSPFTTLLRLYVGSKRRDTDDTLRALLDSVVLECAMLRPDPYVSSLDVLVLSLEESQGWKSSDIIYEFLDNCILRFVRKPVKYYDALAVLSDEVESSQKDINRLDLLLVVVLEQWPFLIKTFTVSDNARISEWLARYLDLSMNAGADLALLSQIRDRVRHEMKDKNSCAVLEKALKEPAEFGKHSEPERTKTRSPVIQTQDSRPNGQTKFTLPLQEPLPPGPPVEDEDHAGLRKWTQKDVQEAIEDGSVEDLIFCLCSKHEEIRKQAQSGLRIFMTKLEVRTPLSLECQCQQPLALEIQ